MLSLSSRAEADLQYIWQYTYDIWGDKQADKYIANLYDKIEWLAENQAVARHRPDIEETCYCFPHEKHVIFFLRVDGGIDIVGIPHHRMDTIKYFDDV